MRKILQAMDGANTKAEVNSSDMRKFLRLVNEAELNQPDPKYVEYAQLMAKHDMLAKEMAPDASGLGVEKGASPDAIASIDAIKAKAEQLAGPNLQAWEQARQKENTASMAQADANLPAMAAQLENTAAVQQSPEQIAYNQLRAQIDSADALRGGANTHADVSPEVTASTNAMRSKLAQMAAALKAKGIDAEAEYNAPDPAVPAAAPVDLATKYVDENAGMSRLLSIVTEGKGPLNRPTTAEALTMQHYTAPKKTITSPVLNVQEGAKPSMIGKYFKAVEQELTEAAERPNERARHLAKRVIERVTIGADGNVTGGIQPSAAAQNTTPAEPAAQSAPLVGGSLPKVEKANRETQTVTIDGQEYQMVHLEVGGIRPRGGKKYAIPLGMLGIRSIGILTGILAGDKVYVLPRGEQESIQEQYSYKDIAEMARLGFDDGEIASKLGFDLSEGLKDPKDNPCWKGYKPVGTKMKGGRTVPNCVPKEAVNPAQQAAIAIAKKKAGKK
jgi:hypothetical protein